ncbi:CoA transferase [bacterium]|nr:CoA transferase [bacterium]
MSAPLSTLKVLDFSTLLPGPFGTMILADLGADVLRVESPTRPDLIRLFPPVVDGVSAAHSFLNRSKRSLAVDLKNQEGINIIKKLVKEYDIVLEQFRPGVMERLGLGYETIKEINPAVIYCSLSGYGQTGPYRDRAGHDLNYLSISGINSYTGRKSSGPMPMGLQVADVAGGSYHAVMGILAAVIHRQTTGEGQYIDVSLTDAAFSMQISTAPGALVGGQEPGLEENIFNGGTFYDCYETKDGRYFSIASIEPHFFERLCVSLGKPEWKKHALSDDKEIQTMLKESIAEIMKSKPFEEWKIHFAKIDACCEPILTFSEACEHPQIKARKLVIDVPVGNTTQKQMAFPIKFSRTKPQYRFGGASLGEHTLEILSQTGYSDNDIDTLKSQGVV